MRMLSSTRGTSRTGDSPGATAGLRPRSPGSETGSRVPSSKTSTSSERGAGAAPEAGTSGGGAQSPASEGDAETTPELDRADGMKSSSPTGRSEASDGSD